MKIDYIIVDDEPLAREGLLEYADKVSYLNNVGSFKSAIEAKEYLEDCPVDLIFLDINMPKMTGLEFVDQLNDVPKVIFTTAYREFALESYDLNAVDYLLKPIPFERFYKAVDKVYQSFASTEANNDDEYIFVKVDGVIQKVILKQLVYIEAMKDYVKLYLENGEVLITLLSLKQMNNILPTHFFRSHRSFIANLAKVDKIDGNILWVCAHQVPVAPQLREEVISTITKGKYYKR